VARGLFVVIFSRSGKSGRVAGIQYSIVTHRGRNPDNTDLHYFLIKGILLVVGPDAYLSCASWRIPLKLFEHFLDTDIGIVSTEVFLGNTVTPQRSRAAFSPVPTCQQIRDSVCLLRCLHVVNLYVLLIFPCNLYLFLT
jgi:hypothetical protein